MMMMVIVDVGHAELHQPMGSIFYILANVAKQILEPYSYYFSIMSFMSKSAHCLTQPYNLTILSFESFVMSNPACQI